MGPGLHGDGRDERLTDVMFVLRLAGPRRCDWSLENNTLSFPGPAVTPCSDDEEPRVGEGDVGDGTGLVLGNHTDD